MAAQRSSTKRRKQEITTNVSPKVVKQLVDVLLSKSFSDTPGITVNIINIQGDIVGDSYTTGQAGSVGPNSKASNMTFHQMWDQSKGAVDLNVLAKELALLRKALKKESDDDNPDHDKAVGEVAAAEAAAKNEDGPSAFEHLRNAGQWVLGVAEKIGVNVATEVLKKSIGL